MKMTGEGGNFKFFVSFLVLGQPKSRTDESLTKSLSMHLYVCVCSWSYQYLTKFDLEMSEGFFVRIVVCPRHEQSRNRRRLRIPWDNKSEKTTFPAILQVEVHFSDFGFNA